jgi:LmbE family N-acetylglucosaminyl deacetylase
MTAEPQAQDPFEWKEPQTILMVSPTGRPGVFCGATIARWTKQGHHVHYCLLTRGDKGVKDITVDPLALARKELSSAAPPTS